MPTSICSSTSSRTMPRTCSRISKRAASSAARNRRPVARRPAAITPSSTIDVDDDEKTGYWLHEGGFYPTSRGYDVNAEIEWFGGRINTGHYINHACRDQTELDQAFLDQSAGQYKKGQAGPVQGRALCASGRGRTSTTPNGSITPTTRSLSSATRVRKRSASSRAPVGRWPRAGNDHPDEGLSRRSPKASRS